MKKEATKTVICNGERFRLYISRDEIMLRTRQLAQKIDAEYKDKHPIFVGVLNGAFIFLADLMRELTIPCEVDFLKLSSYGDEKVSSGQITVSKEPDAELTERHVILVEDIVDTGLSVNYLLDKIRLKNPASLRVLTLLHKKEADRYGVNPDYTGFEIPNHFVVGYGMDYAQKGRSFPDIYIIDDARDR